MSRIGRKSIPVPAGVDINIYPPERAAAAGSPPAPIG